MTIKDLRKVTKCPIYVERTDDEGAVRRTEWLGATQNWEIVNIKIIHVVMVGFVLCVELGEEA